MRFLRLRYPEITSVLLVESGPRDLLESVLPKLRSHFGGQAPFDLVTCYAGLPAGFDPESAAVYHTHSYRGRGGRRRLYRELQARRHAVLVMVCSGSPILAKWKWAVAFQLPVKVLIVNENGDYFWFDRSNWKIIRRFVLLRAGLSGGNAVHTIGRILFFPLTLAYLLLYAAVIHLRRKVHG